MATNISEDVIYIVRGKIIKHHCDEKRTGQTEGRRIK